MADMTTIKGRIAETIYPNGTGAITAESHQALLLEMVDNINEEKQDVLVSGQNIRPLISGVSLLGDGVLAALGTAFIYEYESEQVFAMMNGTREEVKPWVLNRATSSQVAQSISILRQNVLQAIVPVVIKTRAESAIVCWEYDGLIYEIEWENDAYKVVTTPKGNEFDKEGNYPSLHVGTADDLAGRGESVPAEFGFRASGGKSIKDGRAYIKRIKGNSVVWNQRLQWRGNGNVYKGLTVTYEGGKVHIQGAPEDTGIVFYSLFWDEAGSVQKFTKNHYYLIRGASEHFELNVYSNVSVVGGNCITQKIGDTMRLNLRGYDLTIGQEINESFSAQVIDLTQMFQAGNEPSTIEDFNARVATLGIDLNAYNEGEVIHCNTESIKSVGDNALNLDREEFVTTSNLNPTSKKELSDGMWINGISSNGYIRLVQMGQYQVTANGVKGTSPDASYGVGFPIKVLKGEEYTYSATINKGRIIWSFYDKDGIFLRESSATKVTIDNNCHWLSMTILPPSGDAAIDVQDIMITLVHSGWKQDTDAGYQPYWQDTLPLPIINDYFPQGMKSAGSAHDEIRYNKATQKWEYSKGKIKSVDMGTLNWSLFEGSETFIYTQNTAEFYDGQQLLCAKTFDRIAVHGNGVLRVYTNAYTDAATFKAAMQGVILYYESNDWEWVELDAEDQNFRDYYNVADFGTEEAIPATDAEGNIIPSAPFSADIIYQFNAVDMVREHEIEITELQKVIATMQAQLTSLINGGQ